MDLDEEIPCYAWNSVERYMFGRDANDAEDQSPPRRDPRVAGRVVEERRVAAWIGASLVIRGDLSSSEDMTIAGEVEGDVEVREHTVVVAPGARIRGSIVARAVAVHGQVTGAITAQRTVEVGETGRVDGDIVTPRMVVAEGAALHGQLEVGQPGTRSAVSS